MRIIFMGTAEFGVPTLKALHEKYGVVCVVTGCDTRKGRGRKLQPTPVRSAAENLGLDVLTPVDLNDPEFIEELEAYKADLFYVVAFRILPKKVFTMPSGGTVNLHASLLPDYRGAAPINWAVINGDEETGLTTFYIEETVDTGDIILNEKISIGQDETAGELAGRMKIIGAFLSLETVEMIENNRAHRKPQPSITARPAPKLYKEDGRIDWSKDARTIHNHVRGMNPSPGAFTQCTKGPLRIHRTSVVDETSHGSSGRVIESSRKGGFVVSCGRGSLRILEIQPPGKKAMDGASFVRGYRIEEGLYINEV